MPASEVSHAVPFLVFVLRNVFQRPPPGELPRALHLVGDLAPEVTDQALLDTFRPVYASVKSAKVPSSWARLVPAHTR